MNRPLIFETFQAQGEVLTSVDSKYGVKTDLLATDMVHDAQRQKRKPAAHCSLWCEISHYGTVGEDNICGSMALLPSHNTSYAPFLKYIY